MILGVVTTKGTPVDDVDEEKYISTDLFFLKSSGPETQRDENTWKGERCSLDQIQFWLLLKILNSQRERNRKNK